MKKLLLLALLLLPTPAIAQSLGVFASFLQTGQASLTAATASARVALGSTGPVAWVCNFGNLTAFVAVGDLNASVETTTGLPIPAGQCASLNAQGKTHLAGITASGSAALSISTGSGWPSASSAGLAACGGLLTPTVSAAAENNRLLKTGAGTFCGAAAVNLTSTAGFLMVFFGVLTAPADGAVTPNECVTLPASGSASIPYGAGQGVPFSVGAVAVVSSGAGCFVKTTGTITALLRGLVQ